MSGSDPRTMLHRSFEQAAKIIDGVTPDQLHFPTPCSEFDVLALLAHLGGVGNRIASVGRGENQTEVLPVPEAVPDDGWAAAFEATRQDALASWADDEVLERTVTLPFGTFPGAVIAQIYLMELTAHTWDLAAATGQVASLNDDLAAASLPVAHGMLSPDYRGGGIPFEAVVSVPDDASAYDRLAGFLGRQVPVSEG
jgi:uncharacterized protein (TIGR03086 family)